MGREEIGEVVEHLRPDRIGHGILAAQDPSSWRRSATSGSCSRSARPRTSSRRRCRTRTPSATPSATFVEHDVPFTIATDGPEMMRTHLRDELELLLRIGALDETGLREANARGHAAAFRRSIGVAAHA